MTHEWFDPTLPLSGVQLDLVPSGAILPSSEANFWDYRQYPTSGTSSTYAVTNRFYYNNNIYSSGINYGSGDVTWHSPYIPLNNDEYWNVSGIVKLYGPFESVSLLMSYGKDDIQSGIFYYQVLDYDKFFEASGNPEGTFYSSLFSNAKDHIGDGINDFTIFNDYVHNYPSGFGIQGVKIQATKIPYLSDLKKAEQYDVYGLDDEYLGYNASGLYSKDTNFKLGTMSRSFKIGGELANYYGWNTL
jgi:hypothetical protein